jgi:hypothetical protein
VKCKHCKKPIARGGTWTSGADRYVHLKSDGGPLCGDDVAEPLEEEE